MLCVPHQTRLAAVAVFASCLVTAPAHPDDAPAEQMVETIWRVQNLPFEYHSAYTQYACDSLEHKIGAIMQAIGAHDSVIVEARCGGHDRLNSVSVRIALATPVLASEENIRAATTFDSQDELVARLRNVALPTRESIERFSSTWQTISLARLPKVRLETGDCELLRLLNRQVFPKLDVQIERESLQCNPTATRVRPRYQVRALLPALPEADRAGQAEATRPAIRRIRT